MSLIGKRLGNYDIQGKLGEGGMGIVYMGVHPQIGKKVAVKVLHPELSDKADVVTRFFNEMQITFFRREINASLRQGKDWERVRWIGHSVAHAASADLAKIQLDSASTVGRSPCGPTIPILPFPRAVLHPSGVRRSPSVLARSRPRRTVIHSVAATTHCLRFALREVADSVQSHRLLHRALSHRGCDSASCDRLPRFCSHRRLRRVDVAVSSHRSRNRWNALCLESAQLGSRHSEWSGAPQCERNPVSAASESGAGLGVYVRSSASAAAADSSLRWTE